MADNHENMVLDVQLDPLCRLEFSIKAPIQCKFRFSSWENGLMYERFEGGTWNPETLDCGFALLDLSESQAANADILAFLSGIPSEVRTLAAPFRCGQATMLRWIATNQYASELFKSSPLLFWLLVARQQVVGWPDTHIESLLSSKRNKVLSAISGVGQQSGLKFLNRVELVKGDEKECEILINALRSGFHQSQCGQEARIPMHWVSAAAGYPELSHSRAFHNFCLANPEPSTEFHPELRHYARFWEDTLNVARVLEIYDAEITLMRCSDFQAVRRLHDRWTDRLNQHQAAVVDGATAFPTTPIPGNADIHPILTLEDLQAEGRLMHHCVSVYEPKILNGQSYIYRMLHPERATIELRFQGQQVRIGQVTLAYNARPSRETLSAVNSWLLESPKYSTG
ncbi:MAG: PcfJ domain-containing protein [Gammaproteobacteria bacterium]|nr:PcfJ domain-containing protein [Gammaproteobacteria bacterium]